MGTTCCFTLFGFSSQRVLLRAITYLFLSLASGMFSPLACKLHGGLESILIWVPFRCSVSFYPSFQFYYY